MCSVSGTETIVAAYARIVMTLTVCFMNIINMGLRARKSGGYLHLLILLVRFKFMILLFVLLQR